MKQLYRSVGMILCVAFLAVLTGCPSAFEPGETRSFNGIEFQWCPPGAFVMGSPASEAGRRTNESPQHLVILTKGFWLSKYEVTQEQWESVMGSNPSEFPGSDNPVENVSLNDIQEFLNTLNASDSSARYRLPTEAQWEYAYRAGTTTRFYWGDDPTETEIDTNAWYTGNSSNMTHPVGEKEPNAWGLYDMSGNVVEWCRDWYGLYPPVPLVTDPQGPSSGDSRVVRGGSWFSFPEDCRAAYRDFATPDFRYQLIGFRLLRTNLQRAQF